MSCYLNKVNGFLSFACCHGLYYYYMLYLPAKIHLGYQGGIRIIEILQLWAFWNQREWWVGVGEIAIWYLSLPQCFWRRSDCTSLLFVLFFVCIVVVYSIFLSILLIVKYFYQMFIFCAEVERNFRINISSFGYPLESCPT